MTQHNSWRNRCFSILLAGVLAGCGGGSGSDVTVATGTSLSQFSSNSQPAPSNPTNTLQGRASFERPNLTTTGWDFTQAQTDPIRGAKVRILNADTRAEIATTVTDAQGNYSVPNPQVPFVVQVRAETMDPPIQVVDNTANKVLYVLETPVQTVGTSTVDLFAASGFNTDGSVNGQTRASAPFSLMDDAYRSAQAFLAVRPQLQFPLLVINWSVGNNQQFPTDLSTGKLGGASFYDPLEDEIYMLGEADVDTDEFDRHVLVHEWGHYFEDVLSRSDSLGGPHGPADILEPTVAFGEGFGTALSAIILFPDSTYKEASGPRQTFVTVLDVEDNTPNGAAIGWFSEDSCQALLFDLVDPPNPAEPFDTFQLDLGLMVDMLIEQKTVSSFTTIFSFLTSLQQAVPGRDADFVQLLNVAGISSPVDPFGSNETNDGGIAVALPVYNSLLVNGQAVTSEVSLDQEGNYNKLPANRYFRFTATGPSSTVHIAPESGSLIVQIVQNGVDQTVTTVGATGHRFNSTPNTDYMIRVSSQELGTTGFQASVVSP